MLNSNKLFFFAIEEKGMPGAIRVTHYPFKPECLEI